MAVTAIDAVLFLLFVVVLVYQVYVLSNLSHPVASPIMQAAVSSPTVKKSLAIENRHLFSMPRARPMTASGSSQWTLLGTIIGDNRESSYAIIGSSDGQQSVYYIGDRLLDGSVIQSISADEIWVENHGRKNRLSIRWDKSSQPESSRSASGSFGKPFSLMKMP